MKKRKNKKQKRLRNKLNNPNKKRHTRKSNPDDFVTEWQMVEE
tara:strand:- start:405 stop:533 length:129 start_codon:yes stop_codon:yes gene_type:complete